MTKGGRCVPSCGPLGFVYVAVVVLFSLVWFGLVWSLCLSFLLPLWFLLIMLFLVNQQGSQFFKGSPALGTWIRPISRVDFQVIIQCSFVSETFVTLSAHKRFLPSVQPLMPLDA